MTPVRFPGACCALVLISSITWGADGPENPPASEAEPIEFGPADWPWWRGPHRDGIASAEQVPPHRWSATENVRWKTSLPGRGHGSPIVVGERVFLAVADHERLVQSVHCYDRNTGETLWKTDVHEGGFATKGNKKSTLASATPACDGRRVFINFLHDGAVYATALDLDGHRLWQTKVADYAVHQGFGASPALYQSLVIVAADNQEQGTIAALDRANGQVVWRQARPLLPNYTSPIVLSAAGRDQLLFTGCDLVSSFNPLTGEKLWETGGSTTECVASTVTDGELVFTGGGYPKNHVSAVRADGSGKVAWENGARVYVPSMLVRDGYLYAVLDAGTAICWKCDTGKELWKARLGGTFSSSPVLAGDVVYATNEAGKTYLFKAAPDEFEALGDNQLGDDVYATPMICGGRIYMRVAHLTDDNRQEMLYCLENNEGAPATGN